MNLYRALEAIGRILPTLVEWAAERINGGYDPETELRAMMAAGDAAVEERQRAKFGPRT